MAFWVDALGMVVTEETSDALDVRGLGERNHHSVVLRRGAEREVTAVGFKVFSDQDLDRAAAFCAAKRLPYRFVQKHGQTAEGWRIKRRKDGPPPAASAQ